MRMPYAIVCARKIKISSFSCFSHRCKMNCDRSRFNRKIPTHKNTMYARRSVALLKLIAGKCCREIKINKRKIRKRMHTVYSLTVHLHIRFHHVIVYCTLCEMNFCVVECFASICFCIENIVYCSHCQMEDLLNGMWDDVTLCVVYSE